MANTLLQTETVRYGNVEVIVETDTLLTESRKNTLKKALTEKLTDAGEFQFVYIDAVVQTRKTTGLPFQLPAWDADEAAHIKAYQKFIQLPRPLAAVWNNAMTRVNLPPGFDLDALVGADAANDPLASGGASSD